MLTPFLNILRTWSPLYTITCRCSACLQTHFIIYLFSLALNCAELILMTPT